MRTETYWVCSDSHKGIPGHPANDTTGGFEEWLSIHDALYPGRVLVLGDANEGWQFTKKQLKPYGLIRADVQGNHDFRKSGPKELIIGDTLFLHGNIWDSRFIRWVGRPVSWLIGWLQFIWKDIDTISLDWFQRIFSGGEHGQKERYIDKAVKKVKSYGLKQVAFGHLHQKFKVIIDGITVIGTGCCVKGNLDFTKVIVTIEEI